MPQSSIVVQMTKGTGDDGADTLIMGRRNLAACDQCHRLKLKCIPLMHECFRCQRLEISCTSARARRKRGRKPIVTSPGSHRGLFGIKHTNYPVLNALVALGICRESDAFIEFVRFTRLPSYYPKWPRGSKVTNSHSLCSISAASRMLGHLFDSPNQEIHSQIIRKSRLLDIRHPRSTSPALLCSMLCVACYLPKIDDLPAVLDIGHSELVTIRRGFLSRTMGLLEEVMLGRIKPSFDDAITGVMLMTIGSSEDSTDTHQLQWLSFLWQTMRKLGLDTENENLDEEEKEEQRRLWWAFYIIDRHVALSFNLPCQVTDLQCQNLYIPCLHVVWESSVSLQQYRQESPCNACGISYTVHSLDFYGLFLPLLSILGDILQYHHVRRHPTFNGNSAFIHSIRTTIEDHLQLWNESLQPHLALFCPADPIQTHPYTTYESPIYSDDSVDIPALAIYAKHVFHCLHILLYGTMDFVSMYSSTTWQSSSDFLLAGSHANQCAVLAERILTVDKSLFLIYRIFGTYLLQSSFFFLILAKKLGREADKLIWRNCGINLKVLDAFVQVADIAYQRTFVGVLRRTMAGMLESARGAGGDAVYDSETGMTELDDSLMQYRWIEGYHGLWSRDKLGRSPASKQDSK